MSVTRMRSAGFALERSAIIVTGSTMTTLPACSIWTLACPSAVMVMAPPGASTLVVEGSWAYPTDDTIRTRNTTLHRSLIHPPSAGSPLGAQKNLPGLYARNRWLRSPLIAVCSRGDHVGFRYQVSAAVQESGSRYQSTNT